jgi:CRP-like cAMP-binding protein
LLRGYYRARLAIEANFRAENGGFDPMQNVLLRTLSDAALARLMPHLRLVKFKRGAVLQERNCDIRHVHFIEHGVASLISRTPKDGPIEVGMIGRFGLVGVPVILGTMRSPHRCIMQIEGAAYRIQATELRATLAEDASLRDHLLRFVHAILIQHSQTVLCNARHELQERLARWLLLAHDRLDGQLVPVTHRKLAMALGVRRAGVTTALTQLSNMHAVAKRRATIEILDRAAVEQCACACYGVIAAEYDRLRNRHYETDSATGRPPHGLRLISPAPHWRQANGFGKSLRANLRPSSRSPRSVCSPD